MYSSVGVAAAICVTLVILGVVQKARRQRSRYPPGPPALPIIGNVHQLPAENQEHTFQEWGRKYGQLGNVGLTIVAEHGSVCRRYSFRAHVPTTRHRHQLDRSRA